ncbi:MAG: hypothetical protein JW888_04820 [Pirellulales bacterium]|nr:hypothetical protein [Pirellulales bacterium]
MQTDSHPCSRDRSACPHCGGDACPTPDESDPTAMSGSRFVLAAMGLFLAPLVLAILGAVVAGRRAEAQLIGALGGLALGMAGSVLVARWIRHRSGGNA